MAASIAFEGLGAAATAVPRTAVGRDGRGGSDPRPPLRLVPGRPSRAVLLRRRLGAVAVLVAAVLALSGLVGRVGAEAELADVVAGQVVLGPGETLWDVAVATAPAGVDAREHLAAIVRLNGFGAGPLDPWTVVLLPAR